MIWSSLVVSNLNFKQTVCARFSCVEDLILNFAEKQASDFAAVLNNQFVFDLTRLSVKNRDQSIFVAFGKIISSDVKLSRRGHRDRSWTKTTCKLVEH